MIARKELKIRVNFTYSYSPGNLFSIVFVYPKDEEAFILKGGILEINSWLDKFKIPAVVHVTYWRKGLHIDTKRIINVPNVSIIDKKNCISNFSADLRRKKYLIVYNKNSKNSFPAQLNLILAVKRVPRRWIKQLDSYASENKEKERELRLIRI